MIFWAGLFAFVGVATPNGPLGPVFAQSNSDSTLVEPLPLPSRETSQEEGTSVQITNFPTLVKSVIPPSPPAPTNEAATIDFEFQGAPISAILEWYARLTQRSIISAPNLAGIINFRSQTKLTKDEAIEALDSVLAINNIAAIPLGDKFLKIVPIPSAKQEGIPFGQQVPPADTLGTQIIPLKYADAADVIPALQPYLHAYGQLLALVKSNSILITETAGNLRQMLEIIAYVDQPSALRMEMRSYQLTYAKAADVVQRLQSMIQEAQQAGARPTEPIQPIRRILPRSRETSSTVGGGVETAVEGKVIMTADERTNKIFILTRVSNFDFFDQIIAELDAKVEPDVVMKVIELNYATAEDVASLLNSLITGAAPTTTRRSSSSTTSTGARAPAIPPPPMTGGSAGSKLEGFLQYAEGVRLLPDPRTNSLLVMATKEDMRRIEALVKSIDTSVAQVQIEVVIAELTLNNELDVGVDLFNRLSSAANGAVKGTGGNITDGNTPVQISSALASNLPTAAALASGAGGLTYFTTFRNLNLDTIVHALATTANSKVLSTPIIQTMDNQEADIVVGESVPVPTSQTSSLISGVGTLATAGVTSSIQYEDVAIELKVTPRINPDGYVRMDVEQKVNDLGANVNIGGTIVPTILKREAKSSLAVEDNSTIVLGGLIQETKSKSMSKIPILGDIPLLGQIFNTQQNNRQRTELIIFIRPSVLRTDRAAVLEARRRLRKLGMSEELEEQYFPNFNSETNATPRKVPRGPVSMNPSTTAPVVQASPAQPSSVQTNAAPSSATPPPSESSAARESAKIKALKMQDGYPVVP